MNKEQFLAKINENLRIDGRTDISHATPKQLHNALSRAVMDDIIPMWDKTEERHNEKRRAYYLSAEFLMGRAVFNNLYCAGLLDEAKEILADQGVDIACLEEIEDAALGNGGLGRLAACFLDSAAAHDIPLNGYGIRYRYGLFKQSIGNGFQQEKADAWLDYGDAWSVRAENDAVRVDFADQSVMAVPYDIPIIGYGGKAVNTLRLWQSEPLRGFDFGKFDNQDYMGASEEKILAEAVSDVLYPNDNTEKGLRLRLKQQYFFVSASVQDIIRRYKKTHGDDFSKFAECFALQLNDTHPTVAIPELIRIFMFKEGMSFGEAFDIVQKTCNYTNHTVMGEALEKWGAGLFRSVIPTLYEIVLMIDAHLVKYLKSIGQTEAQIEEKRIFDGERIHMARMAIFASSHTNGVAQLHTDILKNDVLKGWYEIFPDRFQNKTNGITPRRWLGLCNPELSSLITEKIGDGWQTELDRLSELKKFVDDGNTIRRFMDIKREKKVQLCDYIKKHEGVELNPDWVFDIQVKRLHEYKRQLLNAFSVVDLYFQIKENKLPDLQPTCFIFGAKAAPAYRRAKGIIKYINEVAKLVNNDPQTKDKLKVLFVQNYNVSYAEKLIPAADISEQISTAGLEASGTGNMKFMLNGALTLGTMDGANVEIVEEVGEEHAFIFGMSSDEVINYENNGGYYPIEIFNNDGDVKKVLTQLIDGTYSADKELFKPLYDTLLNKDTYFILKDFRSYAEAQKKVEAAYKKTESWAKSAILNVACSGKFTSDRTIQQYVDEIWHLDKVTL